MNGATLSFTGVRIVINKPSRVFTRTLSRSCSVVLIAIFSFSACNIDTAGLNLYGDIGTMVSYVRFEHRAYNLATDSPYDTVTLDVGAYTIQHKRLDLPIAYEVTNSQAMEIDSSGMLHANGTASGALIRAYTTVDGVTRSDSVYVTITEGTPATLPVKVAFELNPGDSAKFGSTIQFARGKTVQIIRNDDAGSNMSTLQVGLWVSDLSKSTVAQRGNNATIMAYRPGKVTFYISTYAYGRAFLDSLPYVIGLPVSGYIVAYTRMPSGSRDSIVDFHPKRLTVGMGACVHWDRRSVGYLADVEFEDSAEAKSPLNVPQCSPYMSESLASGNISAFAYQLDEFGGPVLGSNTRARVFTKPGIYKYRSKLYNTTGEILVCDEKNDPSCAPENYK